MKPEKIKFKKWYWVVLLLILGLGIGYYFFSRKGVPVKEIPVKSKVVKRTLSASGVVKSRNEADLSFPTIGTIYDISVEKGDLVEKGQYLAALNNTAESETAQSLKDARDAAERDLELFIENYESNKDAVGGEDEYKIQKRKYEELLSKAEASYQAQLASLDKTYIYAPFSGKIVDVYVEKGETVAVGSSVIKMADEDKKIFEIELEQEDFEYLEEGQTVEIDLDSYENQSFKGVVLELPSYVNQDEGSDFILDIDIEGENKDKALIGMEGDAYIILATTDGEVNALTFDEIKYDIEEKPFVYIIKDNKVAKKYLELGLEGDIYTQIITKIEHPIIQESDAKYDLEEGIRVRLTR